MGRTVLLTGSAGHLGRALRAAFEAQGDVVIGIDIPGTKQEYEVDLNCVGFTPAFPSFDIAICNAKISSWNVHHWFATRAKESVINVSSIYGLLGPDPSMYDGTEIEMTPSWYAENKAGMIGLTKYQATTLAPVRSNCVCPGGIWRNHSEEFTQRYSAKVPLKRMAVEDDIVGPILFLCSDAARYVTGQVLMVDGGYSAW